MAQIQFTGNVGKDAELRHTQYGQSMLTFSVNESKSRRLDDGSWEKLREQWFDVTMFGPAAEALQSQVLKGARVRVAGDFWRRDYESQNGNGVSLDVKAIGVDVLKQPQQQQAGGFQQPQQSQGAGGQPQPQPWEQAQQAQVQQQPSPGGEGSQFNNMINQQPQQGSVWGGKPQQDQGPVPF